MHDPFDALSGAQREFLRLVAKGRSSKEIAKLTGYAPATVDMYLSQASRAVGARSRKEAARKLVARERAKDINFIFPISDGSAPVDHAELSGDSKPSDVEEVAGVALRNGFPLGSLPPIGGKENDLSATGNVVAAMHVALFSVIVFVAIVVVLKALTLAFS